MNHRVALFLVFISIFMNFTAAAQPTTEEERLKEVQEKLEESRRQLQETKKKEQSALFRLVQARNNLRDTQASLQRANRRIMHNQEEINKLAEDIRMTQATINIRSQKLRNRLREVYKNSSVNYLDLLFSARSMSDFINRSYFFTKIIEHDSRLVEEIAGDYRKLQNQKEGLVRNTGQVKELATEIAGKRKQFVSQTEEISGIYDNLKERRERYERDVAELEKASSELERAIVAKAAERRRQRVTVHGSTGSFDWPIRGRITSAFGYRRNPFGRGRHMHTGIDIAAPYGEVIRAADGGDVIFSGWWGAYGKALVIDHGKDMTTVYAHMSRIYLQADTQVKKGQIIGLIGSTGRSTGPHLHFEVRVKGKPQNPMRYLP